MVCSTAIVVVGELAVVLSCLADLEREREREREREGGGGRGVKDALGMSYSLSVTLAVQL